MSNSKTIFTVSNLTTGYRSGSGELRLFENLSISLNAGELVCFMGPNGCGKSTLLRTLAGLQKPLSGDLPPKDERKIAVVLTDRIQSRHMTVGELISYGRYPYIGWTLSHSDTDKGIIDSTIDLVGVRSLIDKKIDELSDGQMQMVMIARALVQDTPILLLDEPTAHLDLNNRLEMMNLLRRLAREQNKAILLATHELDLALQTADVVWLADGKTIKIGIPEDLVLDGSFDRVFQFKGYDLKSGRVEHQAFRNKTVKLIGEGAVYLWTKNAMERNGFEIGDSPIEVLIKGQFWLIDGEKYDTLRNVLKRLI